MNGALKGHTPAAKSAKGNKRRETVRQLPACGQRHAPHTLPLKRVRSSTRKENWTQDCSEGEGRLKLRHQDRIEVERSKER